jgi:hypothetical protein
MSGLGGQQTSDRNITSSSMSANSSDLDGLFFVFSTRKCDSEHDTYIMHRRQPYKSDIAVIILTGGRTIGNDKFFFVVQREETVKTEEIYI